MHIAVNELQQLFHVMARHISHWSYVFVQWWFIELMRAFNRVCSHNFITNIKAVPVLQKI